MLKELRKEADLVIVSNGYPEYIDRSLDITKTREIFAHVQSCIEGLNKTQVLALLPETMKPEKCIMVGDRTGDIIAGRENGVPTIAAAFGYGTPEEWALADMQAVSVGHLTEMLQAFIRN
jgi:phosphoglycolate phosphatase